MQENLKGLITFEQFETIYLGFYYSEEYQEIINKSLYYKNTINYINNSSDYRVHIIKQLKPSKKMFLLKNGLRNEKSKYKTGFYKTLIVINTLFDNEVFMNLLNNHHIDTTILTKEISKAILLKKISREESLKIISDEDITSILKPLNDYYGYNNYHLYMFKIYELMVLKRLQKEPEKKTK